MSQAAAEALAHREAAPPLAVAGPSGHEQSRLQSRPPPPSLAPTANRGGAATSSPLPAGEARPLFQTVADALAHRDAAPPLAVAGPSTPPLAVATAYCPALATCELFRGQGIGRRMVRELEWHAADSRPRCEQRVVVAAAPSTVGLWQRWGYRECLNARERELARAIEGKHGLFVASSIVSMLPRHRLHTSLAFDCYSNGTLAELDHEWDEADSAARHPTLQLTAADAASTALQHRGGSTGSTARKRRAARLRRMRQAE